LKKTTLSDYLSTMKPVLKKMVQELSSIFPYVSILGTDTIGTDFSVRSKSISVSTSSWNERGFVIRVYQNSSYFELSINDLSMENYLEYVKKITEYSQNIFEETKKNNFDTVKYSIIEEDETSGIWQSDVETSYEDLKTDTVIRKLTEIKDKMHVMSSLTVNAGAKIQTVKVSKIFISLKKDMIQSYTWSDCFLYACIQKEDKYRMAYRISSGLKGAEILDNVSILTDEVVNEAISLLDSTRIVPGNYDVICSSDIAGLIAHEAFGHGVEQDMFVKNRAKAKEYMGLKVASSLVDMHDGAKAYNHISSYWFDDEGVVGGDTTIIKKGILVNGINDLLSSLILHVQPTGNGKRESFEKKAYSRMTNTFFSPGKDSIEDMIKTIDFGYLLEHSESGMEDPKNWGIQCVASFGREIKEGKLTGKIVAPIIMTGYVPDLLNSISMVSSDLHLEGGGACGKGHKEYVKVSAGGPYIKAKARLS
jgi:TldD protein